MKCAGFSMVLVVAPIAIVAAMACVRDSPDCLIGGGLEDPCAPESDASGAKDLYTTRVDPELARACASCHAVDGSGAPVFLGGDAAASYDKLSGRTGLVAGPSNSKLVLQGQHAGPALTPAQADAVTAWLCLEVEERELAADPRCAAGGAVSGGQEKTLDQALEEFGACMRLDDWTATGMDALPAAQTDGAGPCQGCHSKGNGGAFLSANVEETFAAHKVRPYVLKLVTGTVNERGELEDLVPARRYIEKGSEACPEGVTCHDRFVLSPVFEAAVMSFVAVTLDRWHQGLCGPGDP